MSKVSVRVLPVDGQAATSPPAALITGTVSRESKRKLSLSDSAARQQNLQQRHPDPPSNAGSLLLLLEKAALFILVLICGGWTVWLALLTVHPNATISRVMKTETYDNGAFWLLIEPTASIKVAGVFGYAIVLLGYLVVVLKLVGRAARSTKLESASASRFSSVHRTLDSFAASLHQSVVGVARGASQKSVLAKHAARLVLEVASKESRTRQYMNVGLKIGDFVLQLILLIQSLENGYPVVLTYLLTSIIVLNSVACVLMIRVKRFQSGLLQVLVDSVFALLIAVGFPMVVLFYCLSSFTFDRKALAINEAIYPPGYFERQARVIANPVEIEVILNSLNSLRVQSALSFFTRVGTNLSLCIQFTSLVGRLKQHHQPSKLGTKAPTSLYPYRHPVVLLFMLLPIAIAVYVSKSIGASEIACSPHPECVVHAFRWITIRDGDLTQCPCITLIDGGIAPKTYAEWQHPNNVTDKVAQLAAPGHLQTIQLINRLLPELPIELRNCVHLKHVSVAYTQTATLPFWFKEFTELEYLHLEGAITINSLVSLPDDLFDGMAALTFLHIGGHTVLRRLPSFRGLVNLRALTLAIMLGLDELPEFTSLGKLERLVLPFLPRLDSIPDMAPVPNLIDFVLSHRGRVCCNGFLDHDCDLNRSTCYEHPSWNDVPMACLPTNRTDLFATDATRTMFAKFPYTVCPHSPEILVKDIEYPEKDEIDKCGGVMYSQCAKPDNTTGMCFNLRMMAIACNQDLLRIEMRRRQIAENVGGKCNPEHEAWLGCPSS